MEKMLIGTILKPQGLNGELKCKIGVDFEAIKDFDSIFLADKDVPIRVLKKSYRLGYLYLTLSKIDERNKADLLRNMPISIDKKFYKETNEDVYLIDDLIDSMVYDENGEELGKLIRVDNYGASDIFVIWANSREYFVPFVKDIFVKVNAKRKVIVANKQKYIESRMCE